MTQPAGTPPRKQAHHTDDMRIYGFFTTRDDSRLWVTRMDGPERVTARPLRHWKLAAGAALALVWSLAAALSNLAS